MNSKCIFAKLMVNASVHYSPLVWKKSVGLWKPEFFVDRAGELGMISAMMNTGVVLSEQYICTDLFFTSNRNTGGRNLYCV
jgi:hypothetical protein